MIWGKTHIVWADFLASSYAQNKEIAYIGCLSTEERSWITAEDMKHHVQRMLLFEIEDEDCYYREKISEIHALFRNQYDNLLMQGHCSIVKSPLRVTMERLRQYISNYKMRTVILDISALPKRFFFPILRFLLRDTDQIVKNVFVIYASPEKYEQGIQLTRNYQSWAPLPTFAYDYELQIDRQTEFYITGAGYMPMSFGDIMKGHRCRVIFPFPSDLNSHVKSWEFVYNILGEEHDVREQDIAPVPLHDVPAALDRIHRFVEDERNGVPVLAPYGPKTFSLAMCLYSIKNKAPVCYTQPLAYHPNYSTGYLYSHMYAVKLGDQDQF